MNEDLDNMLNLRSSTLLLLLVWNGAAILRAQAPASDRFLAVHINALTGTERDAISVDLQQEGVSRITYACVPAGILVIAPLDGTGTVQRTSALAAIDRHVAASRVAERSDDPASLEAQCAAIR
ncbi:MAG: hypothetical protein H6594_05175 [Flavobacteriales bacterium]|nr:hypothetical protein [Flavobacteriales bacterium]